MIENPTVQKEVDVILNGNEFQLRMAANNRLLYQYKHYILSDN